MTLKPCPCGKVFYPYGVPDSEDAALYKATMEFIEKQKDCPPDIEQVLADGLQDLYVNASPRGEGMKRLLPIALLAISTAHADVYRNVRVECENGAVFEGTLQGVRPDEICKYIRPHEARPPIQWYAVRELCQIAGSDGRAILIRPADVAACMVVDVESTPDDVQSDWPPRCEPMGWKE